jgi:transposase, IS30 family
MYVPSKAQAKATVRRKAAKFQGMQIVKQRALNDFIDTALLKQQSPDAIAGRLATGMDGLPSVSADSIYRYIASAHGRQVEYARDLVRKQTKSRKRRPVAERLQDRTFIDDRPAVITNRERVGDLEADFIVSGKAGTGYLLTAIDRKIRYGFIRLILPVTIANVEQAFLDIQKRFPELSSLTLDNDILFRFHERLSELLSVPIYFTKPYSSWQKGSVENYNKQVRKYVKKGADISQYSKEYLSMAEGRLNDRYMSVLSYRTPTECLTAHREHPTKEKSR